MKKHRPQTSFFLSWGMGGAVVVGILYILSGYLPDLIPRYPGGWLVFLLCWWAGGAIVAVCCGPFKGFAPKRTERRE